MSDNPFWDFTLSVYPRPGVADLLIEWQDTHDADVNMMLFMVWTARQGLQLDAETVSRLITECDSWRHQCVEPLRAVRRYLKPISRAAQMRETVKALEVDAEQMQQEMMLAAVAEEIPAADAGVDTAQLEAANLAMYCNHLSGFPAEGVARLRDLLA